MMLQKKVLGLVVLASVGLIIFSTNADGTWSNSSTTGSITTGSSLTGVINTGTNTTGSTTTWTVTTGTVTTWGTNTGWISTGLLQSGTFQIVIDPITKKITIVYGTGTTNIGTNSTWTNTTGGLSTVQTWWLLTWSEFQQALSRMFANGLTRYSDETEYRPDDFLTREEATKIIGQAYTVLGYAQTEKNQSCTFADSTTFEQTLSGFILDTCKRWLFKGSNGKFMPKNSITRPEIMAVLIRMFEGKTSPESQNPRWGDYYLKARALGLTTVNNQTLFDKQISRREVAIYIYRLKNIVTNDSLRTFALNKISQIENTTGGTIGTGVISDFSALANSISVSNDPELQEAISWMNDNGLTNATGVAGYKPFEILNREQASKILYLFGRTFNFIVEVNSALPTECIFKDINAADGSLMTYVEKSCQANIMKWSNSYFLPKATMNKAQFITAMVRMFEGKNLDETVNPRRTNYFQTAQDMGIVSPADLVTFENSITRYEVALFLYRFKVKYQMVQNVNDTGVQNEIISTVPWTITTGLNNIKEAKVYVDMNLLENGNFELWYIEVFGIRYKIVRSNTDKYFSNNFVRYGDIYSLDTDGKIGTVSFIVSNGYVVEWAIRLPNNEKYQVLQLSETKAYYQIKEIK